MGIQESDHVSQPPVGYFHIVVHEDNIWVVPKLDSQIASAAPTPILTVPYNCNLARVDLMQISSLVRGSIVDHEYVKRMVRVTIDPFQEIPCVSVLVEYGNDDVCGALMYEVFHRTTLLSEESKMMQLSRLHIDSWEKT
jgi:hypothetical protein